jgi:hypothetical protein
MLVKNILSAWSILSALVSNIAFANFNILMAKQSNRQNNFGAVSYHVN